MSGAVPGSLRMHGPSLAAGVLIMVAGTLYPPLLADAAGQADHGLALLLCWAMSAGLVPGVGFLPRNAVWRWLLSGWAVLAALGAAVVLGARH